MTAEKNQHPNQVKLNAISRDFRTDTITVPTDEMYDLMKDASRGDDVYREDDATNALQDRIAELAGFEAALFCVSGTMTNQLAIRTHLTQPPHSIILDARSHVHSYEAGGVAFHSQAVENSITPSNGHHITLEDVEDFLVRGDDIHSAPTKVVALENTLSGMVFPQEEVIRISNAMRAEGVIMHLDGARAWEVVAKTGMPLKELLAPFDSVSLCMSKGLGAPIGSVLCGTKEFIKKATWFRKMFGGGIRQSGGLAAAASYVLTHHLPLLPQTHALASHLGRSAAQLGVHLLLPVETNMVWLDPTPLGFDPTVLSERAAEKGLRVAGNRFVIHFQTKKESVDALIEVIKELKEEFAAQADIDEVVKARSIKFAEGEWDKAEGVPTPRVKRMGLYSSSKK